MSSYLRLTQIASTPNRQGKLPISPATIWRKVKAGSFPKPIKLSDRVTVWDASEIEAWISMQRGGVQ